MFIRSYNDKVIKRLGWAEELPGTWRGVHRNK
jgi:hypothetical protein